MCMCVGKEQMCRCAVCLPVGVRMSLLTRVHVLGVCVFVCLCVCVFVCLRTSASDLGQEGGPSNSGEHGGEGL